MAEEEVIKEEKTEKPAKKGLNLKVIFIGLPLFIVQLILVYFITATFLVKSAPNSSLSNDGESVDGQEEMTENDGEPSPAQLIFNVEDLIINPAGTSGQRLLLLSVGFSVDSEEQLNKLKENEVIIKDMIINTVSQRTLGILSRIDLKESLKTELAAKINQACPKVKVNNVYFSKYLIN